MNLDPYQVLGVPHDASDEDVSKAYKKLAKQYHPDLNPGNQEADFVVKALEFYNRHLQRNKAHER